MSVYRCAADQFYEDMMAEKDYINKIWGEVEEIRATEFFEFCKKFSDISLNAQRKIIPGTSDVQGLFRDEDIDVAKNATKKYVEEWHIGDVGLLLEFVYKMHSSAVEWNDNRGTYGSVFQESNGRGPRLGKLYDFARIPKEIWNQTEKEILDYVCKQ